MEQVRDGEDDRQDACYSAGLAVYNVRYPAVGGAPVWITHTPVLVVSGGYDFPPTFTADTGGVYFNAADGLRWVRRDATNEHVVSVQTIDVLTSGDHTGVANFMNRNFVTTLAAIAPLVGCGGPDVTMPNPSLPVTQPKSDRQDTRLA